MEPAGFSLREPERTSPTEVSSGVSGSVAGWVKAAVVPAQSARALALAIPLRVEIVTHATVC